MVRAPALTPSRATEPGDVWPAKVTEHEISVLETQMQSRGDTHKHRLLVANSLARQRHFSCCHPRQVLCCRACHTGSDAASRLRLPARGQQGTNSPNSMRRSRQASKSATEFILCTPLPPACHLAHNSAHFLQTHIRYV